jgi:hypothetical protein
VIAFRNLLFDGQLRRTIGHGTYGGAELGECLATAGSVIDGDRESWYRAWMALADRTLPPQNRAHPMAIARAREEPSSAPPTITATPTYFTSKLHCPH